MELNFKKQNPYDDVPAMQSNSLVKGVFGAVLGSLPGIILWIIVAYLGYTAAIVGFVIAFGIIFGYSKLGGPLNGAGVAVCITVMIVALYAGVHLSWSAMLYPVHPSIPNVVFGLYGYLSKYDLIGDFLGSLGMGYLFGLLGGVGTITKMR